MPAKKPNLNDPPKVMDVAKPGTGKIVTTSRPVITQAAPSTVSEDTSALMPSADTVAPLAPSATRKVIKPISIGSDPEDKPAADKPIEINVDSNVATEEKLAEEVAKISAKPNKEKTAAEAPAETETPAAPETQDDTPAETPSVETASPDPVEETQSEPEPATEPEKPAEPEVEKKPDEKPGDVPPPPDQSSDEAGVNALAEQVKSKKEAAEKAEEQAKRDAEIQGLIESKKYFVPIGVHTSSNSGKGSHKGGKGLIVFIVVLTLLAAGYLLIDAGIIDAGIKVPYELIK